MPWTSISMYTKKDGILFKKKIIVVDNRFHKRDRATKLFILWHEIAHIELSHKYGIRSRYQEVQADRYDADILVDKYNISKDKIVAIFQGVRLKSNSETGTRESRLLEKCGK